MTNEDQLRVIRERLAAITPRHITANPMQWQQDGNYLLQLVTEQQREIEELREELDGMAKTSGRWIAAAIEAGVSPSVTTEAKGYRKQERPI